MAANGKFYNGIILQGRRGHIDFYVRVASANVKPQVTILILLPECVA